MANEVVVRVRAEDQASKTFQQVGKEADGLGKTLKGVGTIASGFLAANVVQQGIGALSGFIGDSIAAIKESIAVNAQLDAVLKSTGGVAGVTAKEVQTMAASMEKLSLFEDEAIISSSSLLLTFTKVGKEIFPQAQQAILDMAQAMNMDLQSATTMVGKALNDPIAGITALSRAGVQFTDDQKKMIAEMVRTGDVAGAQKIILGELETQFGGSAQAASDAAGASEQYKDRMNDLQEEIGAKMLPINQKLMEAKLALVNLLLTKVIPIIEELYAKHWPAVRQAIDDVVAFIHATWPTIQPVFEFAANYVIAVIEGMIKQIQGIILIVTGVIDLISALAHGEWAAAWTAFQQILDGILLFIIGTLQRTMGSIPEIIYNLAAELAKAGYSAGKALADSIVNGIGNLAGRVADKLSVAGVSLGDVVRFGSGLVGRANGGPVTGGQPYLVGERGPELFVPQGSGTIVPITYNHYGNVNTGQDVMSHANDIGWALAMRRQGFAT